MEERLFGICHSIPFDAASILNSSVKAYRSIDCLKSRLVLLQLELHAFISPGRSNGLSSSIPMSMPLLDCLPFAVIGRCDDVVFNPFDLSSDDVAFIPILYRSFF